MDLKHLTDKTLLDDTQNLIHREREIVHQILEHLKEIEKRRLFSSLGYQSLFDYALRALGYSEAQAHVRISSMRLTKEIPEITKKLEAGELSLTNVAKVASFFKQHQKLCKSQGERPMKVQEKRLFVQKIENRSKREVEKILLEASPQVANFSESQKIVTSELTKISMTIDNETLEMIRVLKGKLIHKHGDLSTAELLKILCQEKITQIFSSPTQSKKYQIVFKKANYRCENCGSGYALEVDHKNPKALGGNNQLDNLRLLCRNCNQREAIEKIGTQVTRNWSS